MTSMSTTNDVSALRRFLPSLRSALMLLALAALLVAMHIYAPAFLSYRNLINVLVQSSTLGILALGMTVVLITGGIDLSMPANMALSAIIGGMFIQNGGDPAIGCVIMLASATAIGALNGFAIGYLGMIPFVVTLATMSVASGVAAWLSEGLSISKFPESFFDVLLARIGGVPISVLVTICLTIAGTWLLARTIFGRHLYAAGLSPRAARVARVPVQKVMSFAYVFAGAASGIAAILLTARLGAASANMGADSVVLDIISACVVGGVSIYGGFGRLYNAALGAVIITVISNALNLLGASYFLGLVIKGLVIITFIFLDARGKNK